MKASHLLTTPKLLSKPPANISPPLPGKAHQRKQADYNRQASELIFRENNAPGRVTDSSIDLHGQYVEEAEAILEARIRQARAEGQTHLHVIVGKGNHSAGHVQKLKPRVEQLCDELGLGYETEENEGRIYVDLTGGKGAGKGKGKANSSSSKPSRPSHGRQDGAGKYQKRPSQQERPRPRPQQPPPEEEKTPDLFDCLKVCCTVM